MIRQTLTRLTATTFLVGAATLGVAAPGHAQEPSHPDGPGTVQNPGASVDQGWEASQLAAGALGGILVAGGAIAVGAGIRRHHAAAHTF